MVELENKTFSLEMTNMRFRIGTIWAALTKKRMTFRSGNMTLDEETSKEVVEAYAKNNE